MTANELRYLATRLMVECNDIPDVMVVHDITDAAAYLRACADAMEAGPQPVRVADELPPDRIEAIAHRAATFYRHDEARGHEYMFKRRELLDFAARLLAEAQSSSNACQSQSFGNSEQLAIPQGWKLVPGEPTREMVLGGEAEIERHDFLRLDHAYRAMLASAPTPPFAKLRLPEPMTKAEMRAIRTAARASEEAETTNWFDIACRAIEAEVIKRVKEANK